MNAKVLLIVFVVTMFVTEPAEAGIWSWIKKTASNALNSDLGKKLTNKALNAATGYVANKLGVTPAEAGAMPFDEFMDTLYSN